jgi:hypothetical protein
MGLFHKTLTDAKSKAEGGNIEEAKTILTDHMVQYAHGLSNGIIYRMQKWLKDYQEHLNLAIGSGSKEEMVEHIDETLNDLRRLKKDIKKLIETKRIELE